MTAIAPRAELEGLAPALVGRYVAVRPIPPWKRTTDLVAGLVGLVIVAPLFVVICVAIVLDSRGSPFFRQTRVGRGGVEFTCWKFRSMVRNAEQQKAELASLNEASGHIFKLRDDPRRTRVGKVLRKTSLDELPQLFNVVRGDMSLVGPRPSTPDEVAAYDDDHLQRLAVTPGITGLWQVTLRGRHDFADMVALDLEYSENLSVWLDAKILLLTIPTVVLGKGSY